MNKPDLIRQFSQSMKILDEVVRNTDDEVWIAGFREEKRRYCTQVFVRLKT